MADIPIVPELGVALRIFTVRGHKVMLSIPRGESGQKTRSSTFYTQVSIHTISSNFINKI